jgi:hypothetical protein
MAIELKPRGKVYALWGRQDSVRELRVGMALQNQRQSGPDSSVYLTSSNLQVGIGAFIIWLR